MSSLAMKLLASRNGGGISRSSSTSQNSALVAQEAWQMQTHDDQRISAALLERISNYDHVKVHRRLSRKRLEGTGKWFLARADFQGWSDGSGHSSLWCSGIVGSGKTMLVTAVVEAEGEKSRTTGLPVIYFYCETAQRGFLEASRPIESLIKQLLIYLATTLKNCPWFTRQKLKSFYETSETVPDLEDVVDMFSALFIQVPRATYIIDGLDELDHKETSKVLSIFRDLLLHAQGQKLFISSRKELDYNIDVVNSIPGTVHISIAPSDIEKDVQHYIDSVIANKMDSYRVLTEDSSLVQRTKDCLYEGAKGMFLWVQLQIEALWEDCFTDQDILAALDSLPDDLNMIYERCLQRISRRNHTVRFAVKVLRWVGCASRPLHIDELREAVGFDISDHAWDPGKIPSRSLVISCCANLVVLDSSDLCVRFAHPSVKQYLSANWHEFDYPYYVRQDEGQLSCGEFCVNYLSFSDFGLQLQKFSQPVSVEITDTLPDLANLPFGSFMSHMARLVLPKPTSARRIIRVPIPAIRPPVCGPDSSKYKFMNYAVKNWASQTTSISCQSPVWREFQALAIQPVSSWNVHPWTSNGQSLSSHLHGLLGWAVRVAHIPLLELLLDLDPSFHVREFCDLPFIDGGIPSLHAASRLGHVHVVKLLLRICSINAADYQGRSALHHAAEKGHLAVGVALLTVPGVKINASSNSLETPLWMAASFGREDFVALLLGSGADYLAKDINGDSLLKIAVGREHENVVRILLDTGTDLEVKDSRGSTVLRTASVNGSEGIVRLLLGRGADVNAQDKDLNTALHHVAIKPWIVASTRTGAIRNLLEKGANKELKNALGETALLRAARDQNLETTQLLLEYAANTEAMDNRQLTSLLIAAKTGHERTARLLLAHGADVEVFNNDGTALEVASEEGHLGLVRLLMDHGASVNSGRSFYGSPLQAACSKGHYPVVEALLDRADVNYHGGHFSFALLAAASEGHDQIVRLLLRRGAAINAEDDTHDTALIVATENNRLQVVKVLLQEGADVNKTGRVSHTALHWAACYGSDQIVELLLERSADVNIRGGFYGTALQAACFAGHIKIVKMLLEKGADVNFRGGRCGSALEAAFQQGHGQIVELLELATRCSGSK